MSDIKSAIALPKPRNIVIYSDGTGQRGGLYFDEDRTNVYKLYRATRSRAGSRIGGLRAICYRVLLCMNLLDFKSS